MAAGHPAAGTGGPDTPATEIPIGYARCSHLPQELQSTGDMLHTVLRRANGESMEDLQPDLIIPTGKRNSRRGAVIELADRSPAINVLACATVLRGARRLRVPHGG